MSKNLGEGVVAQTKPRSVFDEGARDDGEVLYFGMIDRAIEACENRVISNGKPAHAVYLIYKMLNAARREVKVLTGKLARTLDGVLAWGDPRICEAAVDFLRRGGRLSILVVEGLDTKDGTHPLVDAVAKAGLEGQLDLAQVDDEFLDSAWSHHFLLMDKSALRIETEAKKAKAVVNFHDPIMGEKVSSFFDYWRRKAELLNEGAAT